MNPQRSANSAPMIKTCAVKMAVMIITLVIAGSSTAAAQTNLIKNGSFESGSDPGNFAILKVGSTAISGWVVSKETVDYIGSYFPSADGKRHIDLDGTPGIGGIEQLIATSAGQKYRVTFAMAGNPDGAPQIKKIGLHAAGQSAVFSHDSTLKWATHIWEFTADASSTRIQFYSLDPAGGSCGPLLDNVSVVGVAVADSASPVGTQVKDLFNNFNNGGVANRSKRATTFTLNAPAKITELVTYHWNFGRGAIPGSIGLRNPNGQIFGPFPATGFAGQGGAPNVNWVAKVNLSLPPGTYTLLDSDPGTLSNNAQSGFQGFAIVRGSFTGAPPPAPSPKQMSVPFGGNCRGPGCEHPDLSAYGGSGPYASGIARSIHRQFDDRKLYWAAYLTPSMSVGSLQKTCTLQNHGQLVLLDDEHWYYYFRDNYARFGCSR